MVTVAELAADLQRLGVRKGDLLLVRAAGRSIDKIADGSSPATALLNALLEAVGPTGTIVGLTFTDNFYFWEKQAAALAPMHAKTPSGTGAFGQSMLDHPSSVRSKHPLNSFAAIGPLAEEILDGHNESATSFFPMKAIIKHGGRTLLIGCASSSPGFSTVHLAQEDLGLATRTLLGGLTGCFVGKDGRVDHLFSRKDITGCNAGVGKFYKAYVERSLLLSNKVGDAYSLLIDAAASFRLERDILSESPGFALCDDIFCTSCGLRTYVPFRVLRFIMLIPAKALIKSRLLMWISREPTT